MCVRMTQKAHSFETNRFQWMFKIIFQHSIWLSAKTHIWITIAEREQRCCVNYLILLLTIALCMWMLIVCRHILFLAQFAFSVKCLDKNATIQRECVYTVHSTSMKRSHELTDSYRRLFYFMVIILIFSFHFAFGTTLRKALLTQCHRNWIHQYSWHKMYKAFHSAELRFNRKVNELLFFSRREHISLYKCSI